MFICRLLVVVDFFFCFAVRGYKFLGAEDEIALLFVFVTNSVCVMF